MPRAVLKNFPSLPVYPSLIRIPAFRADRQQRLSFHDPRKKGPFKKD